MAVHFWAVSSLFVLAPWGSQTMSDSHPATTSPAHPGGDSDKAFSHSTRTAATAPVSIRPARLWAVALIAGFLAALLSWLPGEAVVEYFKPKTRIVYGSGGPMSISSPAELAATHAKNATIAFCLLGGALGLTLGFAGGTVRSSIPLGLRGALFGLVLGIVAGAATSYLGSQRTAYRMMVKSSGAQV